MARETQYKRSLSGSIGSGMKSIMGSNDRRFYVLEHKVSSQYHKAGESQRIIVDEIELGRDPKCQVRFDESFATVSRRHAAIVRDGDNWKLIHLSQVNSTYLNGHKVQKEWYLQSGDEIQLSTNGPKLGFIIPQGEKGLVKSIGLTARMNLFRQQALRPYKTAISIISVVFLLAIVGGVWELNHLIEENKKQDQVIAEQNKVINEYKEQKRIGDSILMSTIERLQTENDLLVANDEKREKEYQQIKQKMKEYENHLIPTPQVNMVDNSAIDACLPGVYYIMTTYFEITNTDGSSGRVNCFDENGHGIDGVPAWIGTGFLLDNGKFVTARHVIEAWSFWQDGDEVKEDLALLNAIANNGGKVVVHLIAVSSTGKQLNLSSDKFKINNKNDRVIRADGGTLTLASLDETDYAYTYVGVSSEGLQFDVEKSRNLNRGEKLTVLGFPLGLGVNSSSVNPVYGSAIVAASGLQDGIILTTDTNYEHGNSGGPVFYTDSSGKLVVIGIVSAGAGNTIGFIVPISKIE